MIIWILMRIFEKNRQKMNQCDFYDLCYYSGALQLFNLTTASSTLLSHKKRLFGFYKEFLSKSTKYEIVLFLCMAKKNWGHLIQLLEVITASTTIFSHRKRLFGSY